MSFGYSSRKYRQVGKSKSVTFYRHAQHPSRSITRHVYMVRLVVAVYVQSEVYPLIERFLYDDLIHARSAIIQYRHRIAITMEHRVVCAVEVDTFCVVIHGVCSIVIVNNLLIQYPRDYFMSDSTCCESVFGDFRYSPCIFFRFRKR